MLVWEPLIFNIDNVDIVKNPDSLKASDNRPFMHLEARKQN